MKTLTPETIIQSGKAIKESEEKEILEYLGRVTDVKFSSELQVLPVFHRALQRFVTKENRARTISAMFWAGELDDELDRELLEANDGNPDYFGDS